MSYQLRSITSIQNFHGLKYIKLLFEVAYQNKVYCFVYWAHLQTINLLKETKEYFLSQYQSDHYLIHQNINPSRLLTHSNAEVRQLIAALLVHEQLPDQFQQAIIQQVRFF